MILPLRPALVLTILLVLLVAAATLLPLSRVNLAAPGGDKLHHLLAFAALALPLAWARPRWVLAVGLLLAGFGGLIELVQPYAGRGRELADWYADLLGIALGSALGLLLSCTASRRQA